MEQSQQGLLERGGSVVHVLQNRNQKGMYVHVCAASILDEGMCMELPRRAPYSPRRPEGVARRTSPFRLKNHDLPPSISYIFSTNAKGNFVFAE